MCVVFRYVCVCLPKISRTDGWISNIFFAVCRCTLYEVMVWISCVTLNAELQEKPKTVKNRVFSTYVENGWMYINEIRYTDILDISAPYGNRYKKFHPQRRAARNPTNRWKRVFSCLLGLLKRCLEVLCIDYHESNMGYIRSFTHNAELQETR